MNAKPCEFTMTPDKRQMLEQWLYETFEECRFLTESVTGKYWGTSLTETPEQRRAFFRDMDDHTVEQLCAELVHMARAAGAIPPL